MKQLMLFLLLAASSWTLAQDDTVELLIDSDLVVDEEQGRTVQYGVKIWIKDLFTMTADKVITVQDNVFVEAEGNIKMDYRTEAGTVEVIAQKAVFYLDGTAAKFEVVSARFGDEFYFVGESVEMQESGKVFLVTKGKATSCNQVEAQWSISLNRARIEREGYAVIRGARFRILGMPVFYFPWMIAPAMQERRSGLLTPDTGGSERNGNYFSQPFYWAPRADFDTTFTPTWHKDAGLQLGLETRYHTRPDLSGLLTGSFFQDDVIKRLAEEGSAPIEDGKPLSKDRYRFNFRHKQQWLGGNLRIDIDAGSDFSVDRDYLEDASSTRIRDYIYQAGYTRPVGRNALYLRLNRLERILAVDERVTEVTQLPEMRFYMPNQHLGRGFYLRSYFYGDWFDYRDLITGPEAAPLEGQLFRGGIDTELSRTLGDTRFVRVRYGARFQGAYYRQNEESRAEENDGDNYRGGAFSFIEAVGPRFTRSYRSGDRRLVHYVDLVLSMKGGSRQEDPFLESVFFDELDIRLNEQVDGFQTAWRVNSRIFAGPRGRVRPLMDVEISQDANIDSDQENRPIETRFRLINLGGFHANGQFDYNPDTQKLDTLAVYTSINRGDNWQGYGGYVRRRASNDIRQESYVGILQWSLPRFRSRFKAALDYNFETNEFKSQELLYGYQGQCVGITLNYVKSPFDSSNTGNKDFFRFTVSLRNLANNIGSRL